MGFKLPVLETAVDCGDLGYPGLTITFWLNPTLTDPWVPPAPADRQDWDTQYYAALGRVMLRMDVPGEYTDSGKAETVELGTAQAVYELEHRKGFDQQILVWAFQRYGKERDRRFKDELGNS